MSKQFIIVALLIICAGGVVYYIVRSRGPGATPAATPAGQVFDAASAASVDQDCAAMLADPAHADAADWLHGAESQRDCGKVGNQAAGAIVYSMDGLGATTYVGRIQSESNGAQSASCIIIELPKDTGQRAKCFLSESSWRRKYGEPASADLGQKYLEFGLDGGH